MNPRIARNPVLTPKTLIERLRSLKRADRRQPQRVHEAARTAPRSRGRRARATSPGAAGWRSRTSGIDDATVTHPRPRLVRMRRHRRRARDAGREDRVEQPSSARRLGHVGRCRTGTLDSRWGASCSCSSPVVLVIVILRGIPVVVLVFFVFFFVVVVVEVAFERIVTVRERRAHAAGEDAAREQDDARDHQRGDGEARRGAGPGSSVVGDTSRTSATPSSWTNATRPAPAPARTAITRSPATASARSGEPSPSSRHTRSPPEASRATSEPSIVPTSTWSPTAIGAVRRTPSFSANSQRPGPGGGIEAIGLALGVGDVDRVVGHHRRRGRGEVEEPWEACAPPSTAGVEVERVDARLLTTGEGDVDRPAGDRRRGHDGGLALVVGAPTLFAGGRHPGPRPWGGAPAGSPGGRPPPSRP